MTIAFAVVAGFAAALAAPILSRRLGRAFGWLIAAVPAGLGLYFASLLPQAARGQPTALTYTWVPALNLHLSFSADGLALLFALLISGIGSLVMVYASGYLSGHPDLGRFYGWLLTFMAAMLGVAWADNLLL
jgi:multicomponent Na+:H+ antiporter subunit A